MTETGSATIPRSETETIALWFGVANRPQLGWLSVPGAGIRASGVVIAPPVGYEYWCSHRALRALAERLAGAGHSVLRIDYDGTGDSSGDQWDTARVNAWQASIKLAAAELRRLGAVSLTLIGARLGGALAMLSACELNVDRVVAWMPVINGRRYARELRLLSTPVPESFDRACPPGTVVVAGNVFSPETLSSLQELRLDGLTDLPARSILVVDDSPGSAGPMVQGLRSLGGQVTDLTLDGADAALHTPPEFAAVPHEILGPICRWMASDESIARSPAPTSASAVATLPWRDGRVTEAVVALEPSGHVAVITAPVDAAPAPTDLVLLNPGSETHVGPGRAWVEYARDLALAGRRSIRVDFLGWGESPDAGRAPGRPYDLCCEQDTVTIVQALHARGYGRVAICGLCASAWISLRAALTAPVAGVIAINPQLYWQRGDPVEIDWDLIRARRAAEIRRVELGERIGLWSLLDLLGHRPRPARWLDDLAATGIPVQLLFAENDDGLVYLNRRLGRRAQRVQRGGSLSVRELTGIDHPMHRSWLRFGVLAALLEALQEIDRAGPQQIQVDPLTPGAQVRPSTQRGRDQSCQRSSTR